MTSIDWKAMDPNLRAIYRKQLPVCDFTAANGCWCIKHAGHWDPHRCECGAEWGPDVRDGVRGHDR